MGQPAPREDASQPPSATKASHELALAYLQWGLALEAWSQNSRPQGKVAHIAGGVQARRGPMFEQRKAQDATDAMHKQTALWAAISSRLGALVALRRGGRAAKQQIIIEEYFG